MYSSRKVPNALTSVSETQNYFFYEMPCLDDAESLCNKSRRITEGVFVSDNISLVRYIPFCYVLVSDLYT